MAILKVDNRGSTIFRIGDKSSPSHPSEHRAACKGSNNKQNKRPVKHSPTKRRSETKAQPRENPTHDICRRQNRPDVLFASAYFPQHHPASPQHAPKRCGHPVACCSHGPSLKGPQDSLYHNSTTYP